MLVNAARGLTKSFGERLRTSGAGQVGSTLAAELSPEIRAAVLPLLAEVEALSQRIAAYDRQLEQLAKEHHPEVDRLTHVKGCRDTDRAVDKPVGTKPYPRRSWW